MVSMLSSYEYYKHGIRQGAHDESKKHWFQTLTHDSGQCSHCDLRLKIFGMFKLIDQILRQRCTELRSVVLKPISPCNLTRDFLFSLAMIFFAGIRVAYVYLRCICVPTHQGELGFVQQNVATPDFCRVDAKERAKSFTLMKKMHSYKPEKLPKILPQEPKSQPKAAARGDRYSVPR